MKVGDNLPHFQIPRDGPLSKGRVSVGDGGLPVLRFLLFGVDKDENPSDKFHLVEHFISKYLYAQNGRQDAHHEEKNRFILSLLDVVKCLVEFGFYASLDEFKHIVTPLVKLLDGTSDEAFQGTKRTSKANSQNILIMDSKRNIISALLRMKEVKNDFRVRCFTSLVAKSWALAKQNGNNTYYLIEESNEQQDSWETENSGLGPGPGCYARITEGCAWIAALCQQTPAESTQNGPDEADQSGNSQFFKERKRKSSISTVSTVLGASTKWRIKCKSDDTSVNFDTMINAIFEKSEPVPAITYPNLPLATLFVTIE